MLALLFHIYSLFYLVETMSINPKKRKMNFEKCLKMIIALQLFTKMLMWPGQNLSLTALVTVVFIYPVIQVSMDVRLVKYILINTNNTHDMYPQKTVPIRLLK